jgi:ParB-like chromosome segregation protein Spo0J
MTAALFNEVQASDDTACMDTHPTATQSEDDYAVLTALLTAHLSHPDMAVRVERLNAVRELINDLSPFKSEPVDYVQWVRADRVEANDYNPNTVAPPEMELLRLSVLADGYTQPIVTNQEGDQRVVVDGFHRNRVGREYKEVRDRLHGYLPVVQIKTERADRSDRIASTIRHNRARGKHRINAMSDIVVELKSRNWTNERVGKELGMEPDEVLRLCQVAGLAELFADEEFSASWDVVGADDDAAPFDPDLTAETSDDEPDRVYYTWDQWEAYRAGFFDSTPRNRNISTDACKAIYAAFLRDIPRFRAAMEGVLRDWPKSTEHNLTNARMNRIAWLGQAAMCWETGIPAAFCNGFALLTPAEQEAANLAALDYLNLFLTSTGREPLASLKDAERRTQPELY